MEENSNSNDLLNLHLDVLKELLGGISFDEIKTRFEEQFSELNYLDAVTQAELLSFNENQELIGAYPISPRKTDYKVTGYSMCEVDALGVAYTFNAKSGV